MESASRALVQRKYFDCERLCMEALERAFIAADYERMGRILLPLEESRRQKRDLAIDTRAVFMVNGEVPTGRGLRPGCYLVSPPRVGVDGRLLREIANKKKVPTVIVVREPASRDGMWPVVSIGPVTLRTKVPPPPPPLPSPTPATSLSPPATPDAADSTAGAATSSSGAATAKKRARVNPAAPAHDATAGSSALPPPEWFIRANEAIGDAAIAVIDPTSGPVSRVETLLKCLQAHPDHEKLHQALGGACRDAAKMPKKVTRTRVRRDELEDDL